MTTYLVHPLVSDGVIKGAKVVEKPEYCAGRTASSCPEMDDSSTLNECPCDIKKNNHESAPQQSIDSALPFENQEGTREHLIAGLWRIKRDNVTLPDGLYDSLSWRVTEVEQVKNEGQWCDVDGGELTKIPRNVPLWSLKLEYRTVLRIVEEKEELHPKCKETAICQETEGFKGTRHEGVNVCEDGCVQFRPTKEPAQPEAPKEEKCVPLTFEECIRDEFLINTQNFPVEYHNLFRDKFNRARNRFLTMSHNPPSFSQEELIAELISKIQGMEMIHAIELVSEQFVLKRK